MFSDTRRVAYWSVIGGLLNTAAAARCFFIHERLVGAWLGLVALAMVAQFYVAGVMTERQQRDEPPET